jgi:hypothetical protein
MSSVDAPRLCEEDEAGRERTGRGWYEGCASNLANFRIILQLELRRSCDSSFRYRSRGWLRWVDFGGTALAHAGGVGMKSGPEGEQEFKLVNDELRSRADATRDLKGKVRLVW